MKTQSPVQHALTFCLAVLLLTAPATAQREILDCEADIRPQSIEPDARCPRLYKELPLPGTVSLVEYEEKINEFLRLFCHRYTDEEHPGKSWASDKYVRDTGPFVSTLADGKWTSEGYGVHTPVLIWYSPDMLEWMEKNRPANEDEAPKDPGEIPDGAFMVKEMYPYPAASCSSVPKASLLPVNGAAIMVRDKEGSKDGWFWGYYGWGTWQPDYPDRKSVV